MVLSNVGDLIGSHHQQPEKLFIFHLHTMTSIL